MSGVVSWLDLLPKRPESTFITIFVLFRPADILGRINLNPFPLSQLRLPQPRLLILLLVLHHWGSILSISIC